MTDGIEAVTQSVLAMALDAASLRQEAIASNIANANVSGYVARRVSFEDQLAGARRSIDDTGRLDPFALGGAQPRLEPVSADGGPPLPVQLDVQAADMARNALQYQALVKGLARHFSILSTAVGDGRK